MGLVIHYLIRSRGTVTIYHSHKPVKCAGDGAPRYAPCPHHIVSHVINLSNVQEGGMEPLAAALSPHVADAVLDRALKSLVGRGGGKGRDIGGKAKGRRAGSGRGAGQGGGRGGREAGGCRPGQRGGWVGGRNAGIHRTKSRTSMQGRVLLACPPLLSCPFPSLCYILHLAPNLTSVIALDAVPTSLM